MGIYGFRHRVVPGAIPFIILVALISLWVLSNALGLAGSDDTTKIFWFKCQAVFLLPMVTAELCFVLEYAGLGKWLNRRTLALLTVVPFVFALSILTDGVYHLAWTKFWVNGFVRGVLGPAGWGASVYAYFLALLHIIVLVWLFARSPRHRWIAGALIIAPFVARGAHFLRITNWNPIAPLDPLVVVVNFAVVLYAFALFRFHMFDVVPVARDTVIERMAEGVMVLDTGNRVIDINWPARALLSVNKRQIIGSRVDDVLNAYPDLLSMVHDTDNKQCEVSFRDAHARWYQVYLSPLLDRRGFQLGRLIWFHDVTDQKRIQSQILDQQRTLAILKERELLARELHDGIGQMLAAVHLQVKSASALLARGDTVRVESCLNSADQATQEAKEFIRDYLLGVKSLFPTEQSLVAILQQYLSRFNRNSGIHTELVVPPELVEKRFDSTVEAQLHPIIQEALSNAQKHSEASSVRVIFTRCDGEIQIMIEDDGRGFDFAEISETEGFGLRSMRGRAEAAGARLEMYSTPGGGTRLIISVPWQKEVL